MLVHFNLCLAHTKRQRQRLMLVYGDAWQSVPDPFPSMTMYANTSGNASVDADARCGYALTDCNFGFPVDGDEDFSGGIVW